MLVTFVEEHRDIIEDIQKDFPDAQIMVLPNRGYDIGPFVHVINQVNLDEYSYVVKLHTKRNMKDGSWLYHVDVSGAKWRNYLLDFCQTQENVHKCLMAFAQNEHLGMVANYRLMTVDNHYDKEATQKAKQLLLNLGLPVGQYGFVMGTMFMCRAQLLKPLKALNLKIDDFEEPQVDTQYSTLAHVIERLLGFLIYAQGYTIEDVITDHIRKHKFMDFLAQIKMFIYRRKIDKRGNVSVKICKIPLPKLWVNRRK